MRYILTVLALALPLAAAAEIYKWRDEKGAVHFGDEAPPNAEKVELRPPTVYKAPPLERTAPAPGPQSVADSAAGYNAAAVANPGPEATVREATGEVPVSIAMDPPLRSGHRVRLYLDGVAVGEPVATTQFTLRNVNRGAHTVHAEVLDANGQELIRTGTQTFYVHRTSVRN